jgi:hypothetical protein
MLDASEVVDKAREYLDIIMPEFAALKPQVEEMALLQDQAPSRWKITFLARLSGKPKAESLSDLLGRQTVEKVVYLFADDGGLVAVRNPDSY